MQEHQRKIPKVLNNKIWWVRRADKLPEDLAFNQSCAGDRPSAVGATPCQSLLSKQRVQKSVSTITYIILQTTSLLVSCIVFEHFDYHKVQPAIGC